ncbi:hypothetical protein [Enterobacter phage 01_vB_Eclo_IJM]|nr:hypothetical protein [Enterobacter phage 01_vB_Eclo_IJM]
MREPVSIGMGIMAVAGAICRPIPASQGRGRRYRRPEPTGSGDD